MENEEIIRKYFSLLERVKREYFFLNLSSKDYREFVDKAINISKDELYDKEDYNYFCCGFGFGVIIAGGDISFTEIFQKHLTRQRKKERYGIRQAGKQGGQHRCGQHRCGKYRGGKQSAVGLKGSVISKKAGGAGCLSKSVTAKQRGCEVGTP